MEKSFSACTGQSMYGQVLVAEDDKMIQNVVFKFLKHMGFDVVTADNGIEALSVFQEDDFVLVLTDFKMPFMDGFTLAGHIKENSPCTPVIMLTAIDGEIIGQKMEKGYVDHVIFKPFKLKDLQITIDAALNFEE
jgi:two-component system response regulator VanR